MSEYEKMKLDCVTEPEELRFHADNSFEADGRVHILPAVLYSLADKIDALRADLARRDDLIKRLVEDANRLAVEKTKGGHEGWCFYCACSYDHAPDCPITLHRALTKEVEG